MRRSLGKKKKPTHYRDSSSEMTYPRSRRSIPRTSCCAVTVSHVKRTRLARVVVVVVSTGSPAARRVYISARARSAEKLIIVVVRPDMSWTRKRFTGQEPAEISEGFGVEKKKTNNYNIIIIVMARRQDRFVGSRGKLRESGITAKQATKCPTPKVPVIIWLTPFP